MTDDDNAARHNNSEQRKLFMMEARAIDTGVIDGAMFASMVRAGAVNLEANRQIVNDLNVFPIPDGDTGDNMYMTIDSGAAALSKTQLDHLGDAAALAARGMLLGARGNSGVILSRIFAGIARGLEGVSIADIKTMCRAFELGVEEAYNAVSVPVEGTILTVYKDAVRYAASNLKNDSSPRSYFRDFTEELHRSLDRTPELLTVLRESGVVDSGGAGFIYIAEGMKRALDGEVTGVSGKPQGEGEGGKKQTDISLFTEDSVLEFGYCTEFLLRLQRVKTDVENFDVDALSAYLNSVGDSVVCFRDGSIVKVHVHTMKPGEVLNNCQKWGEFLTLKIENMTLQHSESRVENRFSSGAVKAEARRAQPRKPYGIVSVAAGDGIKTTFYSLGCDYVIEGGQSMNPSAEDFVKAFELINADTILVYPNNGNVILTAKQAAELYDKAEIRIVPTRTVGEGYAAISMLDTSSGETERILEEQGEIVSSVVTGVVSRASRSTVKDGVSVVSGDYIGFADERIFADEADKNAAALALLEGVEAGEYDILLVIRGGAVSDVELDELTRSLNERYKRTEVITIDGGQPIYDYILVLE